MEFHERLRYWRKAAHLTQEELAYRCGYSGQSLIANYESSNPKNRREPPLAEIPRLADALGIRSGQLVDDRETTPAVQSVRDERAVYIGNPQRLALAIDLAQRAFALLGQSPNSVGLASGILLALEQLDAGTGKTAAVAAIARELREREKP
jgi:transcriptional regulator with XRE-family HTH domain